MAQGRLVQTIMLLFVIDIVFIITGQIGVNSPSSLILGVISDPANIKTSAFWLMLLGAGGIAGLVFVGVLTFGGSRSGIEIFAFVTIALAYAALIGEFVSIFTYLASFNTVLATILMTPIIVLFIMSIVEWLRGKD